MLPSLDRRIVALAVPALGALAVEPLYNLTDTAIVGHLGRAPLAGLALAATVLNVAGWSFGFLSMATTSQVAFRLGRGDREAAERAAAAAYWVAVVTGVVLAAAVAASARPVAALLGGQGRVQDQAVEYLRLSALGLPFLLVTLAGNGHLRGLEDTRTPLRITLGANLANLTLEVVLVYVAGAGIAGSALGTVTAQVLAAASFLVVARRRAGRLPTRPGREETGALLRAGVVLFVRTAALVAALTAATAVAARLGAQVVGGHQIGLQVWLLLALTLDAMAVPAQVFVGQAMGREDAGEAGRVARRVLRLGLLVSVVLGVLTAALAGVVPAVFTADAAVRHNATLALVVVGLSQPLAALAFVYDGLLLGAGDYASLRRAMILALAGFAPLAALTLRFHRLGVAGVWGALACWMAARAVILWRTWRRGGWRDAHARAGARASVSGRPRSRRTPWPAARGRR
ncbi:MAG TPA: MATE family efflux transporter [Acidimicrobiales bacterium]|nr:MATE family efflux transporter [Acidimicrobiales bacterium]